MAGLIGCGAGCWGGLAGMRGLEGGLAAGGAGAEVTEMGAGAGELVVTFLVLAGAAIGLPCRRKASSSSAAVVVTAAGLLTGTGALPDDGDAGLRVGVLLTPTLSLPSAVGLVAVVLVG